MLCDTFRTEILQVPSFFLPSIQSPWVHSIPVLVPFLTQVFIFSLGNRPILDTLSIRVRGSHVIPWLKEKGYKRPKTNWKVWDLIIFPVELKGWELLEHMHGDLLLFNYFSSSERTDLWRKRLKDEKMQNRNTIMKNHSVKTETDSASLQPHLHFCCKLKRDLLAFTYLLK